LDRTDFSVFIRRLTLPPENQLKFDKRLFNYYINKYHEQTFD